MNGQALTVIRPRRGWAHLNLGDLWTYRELLGFLVWRNVAVRYKQTAVGIVWALLNPLVPMAVFSLVFGKLAKMPSDGAPYPLFAFCGLLPWQLFAAALSDSASSLVADEKLVTKVYFPRFIIPASTVLAALLDFAIAGLFFSAMAVGYGGLPTARLAGVPLFILMLVAAALGVGLWLSALNVRYRDVRYTLPLLTQLWLFISPVVYPSSLVPASWRWLYGLNPMAGVIEGFRWAFLGSPASPSLLISSAFASTALLIGGLCYFRQVEGTFADVI